MISKSVSTPKERPILISALMVQAILAGRKTQTRRVIKPLCGCPDFYAYQPNDVYPYYFRRKDAVWDSFKTIDDLAKKYCPYGFVGELLWVRETWVKSDDEIAYKATDYDGNSESIRCFRELGLKWKSPIYMPRAASRITLEILAVRVERLQDISEEDAIAEGVDQFSHGEVGLNFEIADQFTRDPVTAFQFLWESINGKGSWDLNPWVWRIEFRRVEKCPHGDPCPT